MKKKLLIGAAVVSVSILSGCATGLNSLQDHEYSAMEAANVIVEEKNPAAGAWLGLLPGGGSFYARRPGLGIVNFLFWPISILWDPVSGYDGSKVINYNVTKQKLKRDMQKEMTVIDDKHMAGQLNTEAYLLEKKKIDKKYDFE
jgi:hypothetical protein